MTAAVTRRCSESLSALLTQVQGGEVSVRELARRLRALAAELDGPPQTSLPGVDAAPAKDVTPTTVFRLAYEARYRRERPNLEPVIGPAWMAQAKKIATLCVKQATKMQVPPVEVIDAWLDRFFADEFFRSIDFGIGAGYAQWNRVWSPPNGRSNGAVAPAPHSAFDGAGSVDDQLGEKS